MSANLSIAIGAALKAGAEILDVYNSEIAVELKDDRSPLTEADRRGHEVIAADLAETGIPLLSEEGKEIPFEQRKGWDRFWLVDPLDGTKEFIKRNGEFTVNIALVEEGTPVLGVIYVPVKKVLYIASAATGSFRIENVETDWPGDTAARLNDLERSGRSLPLETGRGTYAVVASRSHLSPETEAIIEEKRQEHGQVDTVSMGSSLKLCLVAEGTADLYPRLAPTMEWDTGAGHAIARYAGCTVKEHGTDRELHYNKENLLNPWFIVERHQP